MDDGDDWVRINVLGDGNCFYRSLYGAAKYHTDPTVFDDLLRCLGLGRANLNAPPKRRFTLRLSKGGANSERPREDAMCRKARTAIANAVKANDGELLDTLGDESPYNRLVNLKNMLIQMQFDNPAELMNALYEDIESYSTGNSTSLLQSVKDEYARYFKSSTSLAIREKLLTQALKAFRLHLTGESANENTSFIQPAQYLRDDLTADEFPEAFQQILQDSWVAFLGEMSAEFREAFDDFTTFPKSRGEFADKYANILEKYGEFATEIDIAVLNHILRPCNLLVHVLSPSGPKKVVNPSGVRPLYVLLDVEGEHYNYVIPGDSYAEHESQLDASMVDAYTSADLFTEDSEHVTWTGGSRKKRRATRKKRRT